MNWSVFPGIGIEGLERGELFPDWEGSRSISSFIRIVSKGLGWDLNLPTYFGGGKRLGNLFGGF